MDGKIYQVEVCKHTDSLFSFLANIEGDGKFFERFVEISQVLCCKKRNHNNYTCNCGMGSSTS